MKRLITAILVAIAILAPVFPAYGSTGRIAGSNFFGMHDSSIPDQAWPTTSAIGSVRLWDTGTAWRNVETQRGVYDFSRLDAAVANVRAHGASVMLVLGGTPQFYAKDPNAPGVYGAGFCSEVNDLGAWRNYVRAVATRYKGRITAYEPWNEGDIGTFYCGSESHLITLARIAYQTIKAVDSQAIVSSPSFVDRLTSSQYAIVNYLKHGGYRWANVISYHPYGMPDYGPEQNANLIRVLGIKLRALGIRQPIWSTEINYALPFGDFKGPAKDYSDNKQAAFMTRTYLMQFTAGARRVYWYAWSDAPFLGVKMYSVDGTKPKPAMAMETVRYWMRGRMLPCTHNKVGTYGCVIKYGAHKWGIVRWNAYDFGKVTTPVGTYAKYDMYGNLIGTPRAGQTDYVGYAPVLFMTHR